LGQICTRILSITLALGKRIHTLMPIEDGLYLIHSSGEHIRNYYPVVEYDGQQITTISGASTLPPTEVSCAPSSSFFFLWLFVRVYGLMVCYGTVAGTTTSWKWHLHDHSQRDSNNLESGHQPIWRRHRDPHFQTEWRVEPLEVYRSQYADEWSTCWVMSLSSCLVFFLVFSEHEFSLSLSFFLSHFVRIASFESPPGGNLYVELDSSDRVSV